MSITNDVRSYADWARGQAQTRLTEVRGDAAELAGGVVSRASVTYTELRSRGEELTRRVSALPGVERTTAAVTPYAEHLRGCGSGAAEKLNQVYTELRKNDQIARIVAAAQTAIDTVHGHVMSLLDGQPGAPAVTATPAPAAPTTEATSTSVAKANSKATPASTAPTKATAAKRPPSPRGTKA